MRAEAKRWLIPAALLALTVLITALVRVAVPLSVTVGGRDAGVYVTLGDSCIFLAVLLCGAPWGALIAALGMAIADLIVGSYSYIIGSFLIKGGMALFIGAAIRRLVPQGGTRRPCWKSCFRAALLAEAVMVVGYFVYDLTVFGQYLVAAYEIPLNLLQGLVCGAAGAWLLRYYPAELRGRCDPSARAAAFRQQGAKRRVR